MNKNNILHFDNKKIDSIIINDEHIQHLVDKLLLVISNDVEGDVVELGCYVGESSKYLMKTLVETSTRKKLYVYDSFEGLPEVSEWERDTGWKPGTLRSSRDILEQNFINNKLPLPFIHKDWFKDIPDQNLPEKICFAFLDGDFFDSIYDSLVKIYDRVSAGGYIFFHDYNRHDLPGVKAAIDKFFQERNIDYNIVQIANELGMYIKSGAVENTSSHNTIIDTNTTIVTGLWNLGRGKLSDDFKRTYDQYKEKFAQLLKSPIKMFIYVSKEDEDFIWEHRSRHNTFVKTIEVDQFKTWFPFAEKVEELRNSVTWKQQAGWLPTSPQAKLEYYNPMVMSKMFLLNDASIMNPLNTEYFYWIDAGICNTVHPGYFCHDNVFNNLSKYSDAVDAFTFISYPYIGGDEIHGFPRKQMEKYCNTEYVKYVCRGGFFGGKIKYVNQLNSLYYNELNATLSDNLMGTEESIFTILSHKYPKLTHTFSVNDDGLIWPFFEALKNVDVLIDVFTNQKKTKTNLYVLGFNSPEQFKKLCKSFEVADKNFLDVPKKILINNSTDESTFSAYDQLCEEYGFEEIHLDNIGICGGRQYIAEHFEKSTAQFCMFFEDDMTLLDSTYEHAVCKRGFKRYANNLYETIHSIMEKEKFDFLKLSFSEFYGDNSVQWAWYNVPQSVRSSVWPSYDKLPETGLDSNSPKTQFNNINVLDAIPYVSGQIYYSNWPQIVSKSGNKKMFLTEKWAKPFEQTWMSYIFQQTISGKINPAVLLLSPIEHDRFDHYAQEERKEN